MARRSRSCYMKTLRDPRWQKKRLRVLERAGWECEWCGNGQESLQVHHGFYPKSDKGKLLEPWEAPDAVLFCLCDACHKRAEGARQANYRALGEIHPAHHLSVQELLQQVKELIKGDPALLARVGVQENN